MGFKNRGDQLLNKSTEFHVVEETNYTKLSTPKKQKLAISISIIGLIMAGCIMFVITIIMNNDYNRAKSYYSRNDTSRMTQLYTTMSDVDSNKVFDYLEMNAQIVGDDYIAEKISYGDARSNMSKIKSFYKENAGSAYIISTNNIIRLFQSRKSYEIADDAEENNLFEVAYKNYKKVIEIDLNYNIANDKMNSLCPVIASQFYVLAKGDYELVNYSNALQNIYLALSYEPYNQDMLQFKDECEAKRKAQNEQQAEEMINQMMIK